GRAGRSCDYASCIPPVVGPLTIRLRRAGAARPPREVSARTRRSRSGGALSPPLEARIVGLPMPDPDERRQTSDTKRLLILGSTGSIGTQALEVCAHSGEFELVGLSAERSWQTLVEQARAHGVKRIALADGDQAARAAEAWCDGEVLGGAEGLVRLVVESQADLVLNALVGSAGLGPTVAALGEGIDLALANKESLVVGGELVVALAQATGAQIVPVDSEHTALHQL